MTVHDRLCGRTLSDAEWMERDIHRRRNGTAMGSSPFSVAMCTYKEDDPQELSTAIDSVIEQTQSPSEIILVKNGPIPETLETVIESHRDAHPELFSIINLDKNHARGVARQISIEECDHELVALMDTDDVSVSDRFQTQLEYLEENPTVDVVGGYVAEFNSDPECPSAVRKVPLAPKELESKARFRSPLNQPTVMARKQALLDAGGYRDIELMEDYDLWVRVLLNGGTIANIPKVLTNVQAGTEMYKRRGGVRYTLAESKLLYEFFKMGFITLPVLAFNLAVRIPVRLVPNALRGTIYSNILRNDG
jgi:glycosyltransferase involved in cell wall biosynthesis